MSRNGDASPACADRPSADRSDRTLSLPSSRRANYRSHSAELLGSRDEIRFRSQPPVRAGGRRRRSKRGMNAGSSLCPTELHLSQGSFHPPWMRPATSERRPFRAQPPAAGPPDRRNDSRRGWRPQTRFPAGSLSHGAALRVPGRWRRVLRQFGRAGSQSAAGTRKRSASARVATMSVSSPTPVVSSTRSTCGSQLKRTSLPPRL